jgi:hypothetical protein
MRGVADLGILSARTPRDGLEKGPHAAAAGSRSITPCVEMPALVFSEELPATYLIVPGRKELLSQQQFRRTGNPATPRPYGPAHAGALLLCCSATNAGGARILGIPLPAAGGALTTARGPMAPGGEKGGQYSRNLRGDCRIAGSPPPEGRFTFGEICTEGKILGILRPKLEHRPGGQHLGIPGGPGLNDGTAPSCQANNLQTISRAQKTLLPLPFFKAPRIAPTSTIRATRPSLGTRSDTLVLPEHQGIT